MGDKRSQWESPAQMTSKIHPSHPYLAGDEKHLSEARWGGHFGWF